VTLLKAPIKHILNTTLHVHVAETARHNLDRCAEFIGASASYIVSEALKLLFRKDAEFKHWAGHHRNHPNAGQREGEALTKTA